MARNTKRLFRAFTTKSSRGEKWRKSTTHSVTRVARVPHGPGAPKLIKWRFSSAHRRRFGSFPHVTTNTTGQLAVTWRDTGRKVEELRGGRWRDPGEEGGGTQGSKVEEPRGARWRNSGEEGGGQREHHETTRETQWGDFCKAVRELACCSALRRWATKNTRRESEAHAWEDAAVRHRRVAEVFGEVHASTRKRNVTLAAAGPDRWSW